MSVSLILGVKEWFIAWMAVIPKFIYFICMSLCSLLDAFQLMLRKLAGLDTYYIDGNAQTGDIAYVFIRNVFEKNPRFPAIKNAFWALVIFAVVLLVIVTIISIIRQEYLPSEKDEKNKPSNNKMSIVKNSFKSLFLFFIVPIVSVFGLFISDILLGSLDSITSSSPETSIFVVDGVKSKLVGTETSTGTISYTYFDVFGFSEVTSSATISGMMFKTAAYTSNRVRIDATYNGQTYSERIRNGSLSNFGIFNLASSNEECAQMIDEAFANNVKLADGNNEILLGELSDIAGKGPWSLDNGDVINHMSKFRVGLVWYYYDLWQFNFLIGFAVLVVSLKLLFDIVFGLMKRLIEMVALFIISPPLIATMPLDNGKAFKDWRKKFISKALSVYGAIIGMNVIFLILPYLYQIDLFPSNKGLNLINMMISSLFIIVGLVTVKGLIALMSQLVGGDDLAKEGEKVGKSVGEIAASSAVFMGGAAGLSMKMMASPLKMANNFARKNVPQGQDRFKRAKAGAKSKYDNMFIGKKQKDRLLNDTIDEWEKGEGDKSYEEMMQADEDYQKEIDTAYKNYVSHWNSNKSKDDWLASDTSKKAREQAENDFAKKIGASRQQYISSSQARNDYVQNGYSQKKNEHINANKAKIRNTMSSGVGAVLKATGAKNLSSLFDFYSDDVKGSVIRSGKGGLKSMVLAFSGKTSSEMEKQATLKKLKKEEEQRQIVRIEQERKNRK